MTRAKGRFWSPVIWALLGGLMSGPVIIAAFSPFIAGRDAIYLAAGFAGIFGLALFLVQPLLAAGWLPGMGRLTSRRAHRWVGGAITLAVIVHVGGLYLTSPPDTMDALLLVSPTAFSLYGVLAMWGIVATVILVLLRRRLGLRYATWRIVHNALALGVIVATIIHALQIQGAMGDVSKWVLCIAVLATAVATLAYLRVIKPLAKRRARAA